MFHSRDNALGPCGRQRWGRGDRSRMVKRRRASSTDVSQWTMTMRARPTKRRDMALIETTAEGLLGNHADARAQQVRDGPVE